MKANTLCSSQNALDSSNSGFASWFSPCGIRAWKKRTDDWSRCDGRFWNGRTEWMSLMNCQCLRLRRGMAELDPIERSARVEYAVLVTEHPDGFQLHVPELLLTVRAPTLQSAYDELLERRRELLEGASIIGKLHTLPAPQAPPPIIPTALSAPG
jgi:hypothetical protein